MSAQSRLKPCPKSPNCFSSKEDSTRRVKPLPFKGSLENSKAALKSLVLGMERTEMVEENGNYMHFTFTTKIMSFTDDVEFEFDEMAKVIHFRSASRVGWSDIWANKRRLKKICSLWEEGL